MSSWASGSMPPFFRRAARYSIMIIRKLKAIIMVLGELTLAIEVGQRGDE